MKQLSFFVFIFIVYSLFVFLLPPTTAYAALPDECAPAGGTCRYGSCPARYSVDYRYGCSAISQRCCMPPLSCEARGSVCRPWAPGGGGGACLTAYGGAQSFPNTCSGSETCCNLPSCASKGGACQPMFGGGGEPNPCTTYEIVPNWCTLDSNPDTDGRCCAVPGGGGGGGGGSPPRYSVTGYVWADNNRNGTRDAWESGVINVTIVISGRSSGSRTTNNSNGNFPSFANLLGGNYAFELSVPPGYINTTPIRLSRTLGPSTTVTFGIVQLFSISGNVFNDASKNRYKDSTNGVPEVNVSGITMSATAPISFDSGAGTFVLNDLLAGTYTVRYTSPMPDGYFLIYPRNGPPPAFSVTVGPDCAVDGTSGATCNDGNVNNLNFAISNSIPWMQSYGLSLRIDDGFDDVIPANPLYPPYASVGDRLNEATSVFVTEGILPSNLNGTDAPHKVYVSGLTPGASYKVIVSGTYRYQQYSYPYNNYTDAQWDDWQNSLNCFCRRINKVAFNGVALDASDYQTTFNPATEYSFVVTAGASPLEMYITDDYYGDNDGWLSYRIYTR